MAKLQYLGRSTEERWPKHRRTAIEGDILIFPEFIKEFGYTSDLVEVTTNEDGTQTTEVLGQIRGLLALTIMNNKPSLLFINNKSIRRKSAELICETLAPQLTHSGTRELAHAAPSNECAYIVAKAYQAVSVWEGKRKWFTQLGIDRTDIKISYTDTHMTVGDKKFLIEEIKALYKAIENN